MTRNLVGRGTGARVRIPSAPPKNRTPQRGVLFFRRQKEFENRIQAAGGSLAAASWMAAKQLFSAEQKMQTNPFCSVPPNRRQLPIAIKEIVSIVFTKYKKKDTPKGCPVFRRTAGIQKSNPSCRWQLGHRQLDGGKTTFFWAAENADESLLLHAA